VRVAFVNHTGEISGGEVSLLHILEALGGSGIDSLLVAPEEGRLAARARQGGVAVRTAPFGAPRFTASPVGLARGARSLGRSARLLGAILREEGVDVVHANSARAGLIASLSRRHHRRPVVWSVRDFLPLSPVGLAVRVVAWRTASRVLTNSRAVRDDFARWAGLRAKTAVLYPGVPARVFERSARGVGLREAWGIPAGALVVGYVGQIAPWKRVHDALTAFHRIAYEFPVAHLVVVGAPKFRSETERYFERLRRMADELAIAPRVHFVGFEPATDRVFQTLDVLLHPAHREPFGRVLVEAMAQGVPVVASADGGIPEIVQDGRTGFLVPVGDVPRMASRLSLLLGDEARRREIGDAGRESARERFCVECSVQDLVALYRELAA
jgi:glycosyltransferase involved in cell wall biosynthesis